MAHHTFYIKHPIRLRWLAGTATMLCLILSLLLSSCSSPSSPPASQMGQGEILRRFANLQEELKVLRSDVGQLRQTITNMQRSAAVSPRAATPSPTATGLSLNDDNPILGNRQAPVAIVEFSDYQCAPCLHFHTQTFSKLKETYIDTGKVQYIWRNFPPDGHAEAKGAAIAANCAGKQGAHWKMHQGLLTNQHRLGASLYTELAKTLKLRLPTFQACLREPAQAQEVDNDVAYGQRLGIRGMPNFFVGRVQDGRLVEVRHIMGAQAWPVFAQALDALLK